MVIHSPGRLRWSQDLRPARALLVALRGADERNHRSQGWTDVGGLVSTHLEVAAEPKGNRDLFGDEKEAGFYGFGLIHHQVRKRLKRYEKVLVVTGSLSSLDVF